MSKGRFQLDCLSDSPASAAACGRAAPVRVPGLAASGGGSRGEVRGGGGGAEPAPAPAPQARGREGEGGRERAGCARRPCGPCALCGVPREEGQERARQSRGGAGRGPPRAGPGARGPRRARALGARPGGPGGRGVRGEGGCREALSAAELGRSCPRRGAARREGRPPGGRARRPLPGRALLRAACGAVRRSAAPRPAARANGAQAAARGVPRVARGSVG
jgi:hypothetical protein